MITENLSTLKIHRLTQEQYDRESAAGNIDETAIYFTPDNYATKDYVDSHLSGGITRVITDALPSEPSENIIYMIPSQNSVDNNIYDEYMFFNDNGMLIPEIIGSTAVDLSGYLPLTGGTIEGGLEFTDGTGMESSHISPSGLDFYAPSIHNYFHLGSLRLENGSFYTEITAGGVEGSDEAKASWQEWLGVSSESNVEVDQIYNPESENAQSGKALAPVFQSKIGMWQSYTKYEVGDYCLWGCYGDSGDGKNPTPIYYLMYCQEAHTSDANLQSHSKCWRNLDFCVPCATKDGLGRYIISTYATKEEVGNIETALDNIIAIQNQFIGGDA